VSVLDQTIDVARGEDAVIPFAGGGDVTGVTLSFGVAETDAGAVLSGFPLTEGAGIEVTDGPAGEFTVTVPAALTLARTAGARYRWGLWDAQSGSAKPLAGGPFVVRNVANRPA